MPIYEYRCRHCNNSFEELVLSSREVVTCPECESKKVEKRLSVFSSLGESSGRTRVSGGGGCGCTPSTCGCH